jgi:quinoprotein glucose dehydrogenase
LIDVDIRLSAEQIASIIRTGRGRMPPFSQLSVSDDALVELVQFLRTGRDVAGGKPNARALDPGHTEHGLSSPDGEREVKPLGVAVFADRYQFTGYKKFLDPEGYPAVVPPWGTLSAIDLNTGKYLWKVPLGEYPELAARGMRNTGSENYGGPLLTASGLLFIGATIYDHKLRVFDSKSGDVVWQTTLPYSGTATPATYMVDSKQYVVICTNDARDHGAPQGSAYVAFALQ